MLCELHSVYKIIHCIHCVILHRGSQIIIHYTVKGQFFTFNLEKNYTGQKKFTQAPLVVLVTNMRYVFTQPIHPSLASLVFGLKTTFPTSVSSHVATVRDRPGKS